MLPFFYNIQDFAPAVKPFQKRMMHNEKETKTIRACRGTFQSMAACQMIGFPVEIFPHRLPRPKMYAMLYPWNSRGPAEHPPGLRFGRASSDCIRKEVLSPWRKSSSGAGTRCSPPFLTGCGIRISCATGTTGYTAAWRTRNGTSIPP